MLPDQLFIQACRLRRFLINFHVKVHIRPFVTVVFLQSKPVSHRQAGQFQHLPDTVLRDAGKSGNVNDRRYSVNIFKLRKHDAFLFADSTQTAIHISRPVAHKRTALKECQYNLILLVRLYLIHQIGTRHEGRIRFVFQHIFLRDEFIKSVVREEYKSVSAPGFRSQTGRFGSPVNFQRTPSPCSFQLIFKKCGIRPDADETLQIKQILGLHRYSVPAAQIFRLQYPVQHMGPDACQLFQGEGSGGSKLLKIMCNRIHDAAHAKELVDSTFQRIGKSFFILLTEGKSACFLQRRHKPNVHFRCNQKRKQTGCIRKRRQSIKHLLPRMHTKHSFLITGRKDHGSKDIGSIYIQHLPGVRCQLLRPASALPGGLQPDHRLSRKHVLFLVQQYLCIVFICSQRNRPAELLHGGRACSAHDLLSQTAPGIQINLLVQKAVLYLHVFIHGQIQKSAVFIPDLPGLAFFQFFFKTHCGRLLSTVICLFSASETDTALLFYIPRIPLNIPKKNICPGARCREGSSEQATIHFPCHPDK